MPKATCTVDGCVNPVKGHGLCNRHYQRMKAHGSPTAGKDRLPQASKVCTVEGCENPSKSKGLCQKHYIRLRKFGTTDDPPAPEPKICLVEDCTNEGNGGRGWCYKHYRRWRIHGDTETVIIPTRQTCTVGDCDRVAVSGGICDTHNWRLKHTGSVQADVPIRSPYAKDANCNVGDCSNSVVARSMCGMHYQRWAKYGDPEEVFARMEVGVPCLIEGCSGLSYSRGWCLPHYTRWRFHQDPLAGGTFQGSGQAFIEKALADETGDCIIWPYGTSGGGYGTCRIDGVTVRAHRYVLEQMVGPAPEPDMLALHAPIICHNPRCIQWRHLRWGTAAENRADMDLDDTVLWGERNYSAKLTRYEVRAIRLDPRPDAVVALDFGVSPALIWAIKNNRIWRRLP